MWVYHDDIEEEGMVQAQKEETNVSRAYHSPQYRQAHPRPINVIRY